LAVACGHGGAIEKLTKQEFGDEYVRLVGQFLAGKPVSVPD